MKNKIQFAACFILIYSTLVLLASAQGTAFTYHGRLNDGANPANGSYDLRFTLYDMDTGGSQQGPTLTNSTTAISNGLFTVTLDFGSVFPGAARYLEIAVRTNGGSGFILLNPRQLLTPTPYAITARNLSGILPAAQLSGSISSSNLSGAYAGAVTMTNQANVFVGSFTGNGAGMTNVNVATLGGLSSSNFWKLSGNTGANPTNGNFIGTTDNLPLEIKVNGQRALRLEPNTNGAPHMIGGSQNNYVSNGVVGATIAGGGATNYFGNSYTNRVTANFGTVSGGYNNIASGHAATVNGGSLNTASASGATVSGFNNTASSSGATVGGGQSSTASGSAATVSGGEQNTASGDHATVPGGLFNTASGSYSFAAGLSAQALHSGSFVWADNNGSGAFSSTTANQFSIRASGGIRFAGDVQLSGGNAYHNLSLSGGNAVGYLYGSYPAFADGIHLGYNYYADSSGIGRVSNSGGATSRITAGYGFIGLYIGGVNGTPNTQRLYADSGGVTVNGTFNNNSDRNTKQDFTPVSASQILESVLLLPVSEWSYKDDPTTRHIGPMAQDFHATFQIGTDDRHIAPIDEGGLAFAAIQGLNAKVEARSQNAEDRIQELEMKNAELRGELDEIKSLLKSLNEKQSGRAK